MNTRNTIRRGTKVRTVNGTVETVMDVTGVAVTTYESAMRCTWYHPTKVWPVR